MHGKSRSTKRGPPSILSKEEEKQLETYKLEMAEYGHPLTTEQLKTKVALLTHERVTPFKIGVPGNSWLHWFHKRHPNLTTRQAQELEFSKAKGLFAEKVASFMQTWKNCIRNRTIHLRMSGTVMKVMLKQGN